MGKVKGIIFDFNGTLFWDSKMHEKAWCEFALEYANRQLSDNDLKNFVHGRINRDIIRFIFNKEFAIDEIQQYSDVKENIYRNYLTENESLIKLAPGAVELLNFLLEQNFPRTIATSAEISNVDFYFKNLNLDKWFDFSKIVYDNGKIYPKPAPDIFLLAAKQLQLKPDECMVIEDSVTGIQSARNAGIGKVLFIENDETVEFNKIKDLVDGKISNFHELMKYI